MTSACSSCACATPHLRFELLDLRLGQVDVLLDQLVDLDLRLVEGDGRRGGARVRQSHVDRGLRRGAWAGAGLPPRLGIGEVLVGLRAIELGLRRDELRGRRHLYHLQVDPRILRLGLGHRESRGRLIARRNEDARIDLDHEIALLHAGVVVDFSSTT